MTTVRRLRTRKTALALAAALSLGAIPQEGAWAAACTFNPTSGNWNASGNWSCAVVPSGPAGDSATIGGGKTVTINDARSIFTLGNSGTLNIDAASLSLQGGGSTSNTGTLNVGSATAATLNVVGNHTITNTGGVISIAGGSAVNHLGGNIVGGSIAGAGTFRPNASFANFLDGVSFGATLDMTGAQGVERVINGLTLTGGTINIGATSVLVSQGSQTFGGSGRIVFDNSSNNNRFFIEAGHLTLASGVSVRGHSGIVGQQTFIPGPSTLTNNGSIQADVAGGLIALTVNGLTTNNGTLGALNGGTLNLHSNVAGGAGSQMQAGAGSVINQNGITLSGALNITGAGAFRPSASFANFLDGVTLSGTLDMAAAQGLQNVTNGLTLDGGTINIGSSSVFAPRGNQTIAGAGSINFTDSTNNNRLNVEAGNLTLASGVTVRGHTGVIGQQITVPGAATLTNNGTIQADVAGGAVTLAVNGLTTNNGTLAARNGGTLNLSSNIAASPGSQIVAGAGSVVNQNGITITGAAHITGTGSFRPSAATSNLLDGVTLRGVIDMSAAQGFEKITNGLTLNGGTINIGATSLLVPQGSQTIGGTGNIVFTDGNGNNRLNVEAGNLTLASGITVRGHTGLIGQQFLGNGAATLTNNGTIGADVAGGTLTLAVNGLTTNTRNLRADNGGVLSIRSTVSTTETGAVWATTGSSALFAPSATPTNLVQGVLTSGAWNVMTTGAAGLIDFQGNGTAITTLDANLNLFGVNSQMQGRDAQGNVRTIDQTLSTNLRGLGLNTGRVFTASANGGNFINSGAITLGDGASFVANNLTLAGTSSAVQGQGLSSVVVMNPIVGNGSISSGTGSVLSIPNGFNLAPGSFLSISNLGTVNLAGAAASTVDRFFSRGSLALGAQNLQITKDYDNTNFGEGNAFNARANVSGAGQIIGVNANQTVTGNVTPAGVNTFTLNLGNVRGGTNTAATFQVANNGNGADIRGALQTTGLTDSRLSGSGAAAANFGPIAAGGNSGNLTVNFSASSGGSLTEQRIVVASNFGNVATQTINLTGLASALAVGSATPSANPVNLGNFRVGGAAPSQSFAAQNTTSGAGAERLGIAGVSSTGNFGATNLLGAGFVAPGASQAGAFSAAVAGGVAGVNTGSVTVNYTSNGTLIDPSFTTQAANAQTIDLQATGYRLAQAGAIAPVNFGNVLAGSTQTRTITVSNTATADGFSEALNAAFGPIGGANAASFSTSGAVTGLLAGNSNSTSMVVTLNTSSTGTKSANVQILLDSNGNAIGNGLGLTALPTQTISLDGLITGVVGNLASAGLSPTNVNFGKFREGAANQTQQLTVSNLTTGPGEGLNASFGAATGGGGNNGGSITSLATAGSNNTTMSVSLTGLGTAGAKSGTQVLNFVSDGSFNSLVPTPLPSQTVSLSAEVFRLATAGVNNAVNLAARRVGDAAATGSLTLSNTAAADGFSEGLRGSFGATPAGFGVGGASTTALIAAGASEGRTVSLSTATAGSFSGNLNIALASNGAGTSGFGDATLADKSVSLAGKVYTTAIGQSATPVVDFGIVRVGDTVSARNIAVNNAAAATGLNDTLRASLSGVSGPFVPGGAAAGVAAQGSGQIGVGLSTANAGVFIQTGAVAFASQNPDMADVSVGANAGVQVLAQVNHLANADFDLLGALGALSDLGNGTYVLNLGPLALGTNGLWSLRIDNDVAGPADALRGVFDLGAVDDFSLGGFGNVAALEAGQLQDGLEVGFSATQLGSFEDRVTFHGLSFNASDPDGRAQSRQLLIRATVFDPHNGGTVPEPGTLALLLLAALAALKTRAARRTPH